MAEGCWTQGVMDVGAVGAMNGYPPKDNFRRATSGTAGGTAGLVISSKAGRFYRGVFENGAATAYYLQIFDKSTAPVNSDVPIWEQRLPSSGELLIDLTNVNGLPCTNGIGIAISSTAGSLTLAIANDLAFRSVVYTASN